MSNRPLWLAAAPVMFLLLWSAGFGIAKLSLQHAEPLTLLALRYSCVLILLLPLALILRPPLPKNGRAWADIAITGFLIQVVYFGLCYIAFKSGVSASGVAIIVCLQPILVALAAPYTVGEATTRLGWIGLGLGLAGAALARVSALFYLVPALSALFAWPLLGEAMPSLAWAGMALAGLGVALVSKKPKAV